MKKYIGISIIVVVLAVGYFFMSKQTIPTPATSSGVVIEDFNLTFDIPNKRIVSIQPNRLSNAIHFRLSTPYKDTEGYQVFADAIVQEDTGYIAQIVEKYGKSNPEGKTMNIDCDGVTPSKCLVIYSSGSTYMIGVSAMSLQPQATDMPSSVTMQDYNQVADAIEQFLLSVHTTK